MSRLRILVMTGYGINCQQETAHAFSLCGAEADIVHIEDIIGGMVSLADYQGLVIPGGFSYGDHLGSGKALANKISHARLGSGRTFLEEIGSFVDRGGHVLGICNGFQVLVKSGLLPGFSGQQEATLCQNSSARFEDRWVHLKINPRSCGGFLAGVESLFLPVRHGEGRFIPQDDSTGRRIAAENLIVMQYAGDDGQPAMAYPENPNGSHEAIAGISDATGHIIGIMPHPEAFLYAENHPRWSGIRELHRRNGTTPEEHGDGIIFFRALVNKIQQKETACVRRGMKG